MASGETLVKICNEPDMPEGYVFRYWIIEDRDGLTEKYARARALQIDYEVDECREIADTFCYGETTVEKSGTNVNGAYADVTITKGDMVRHRDLQIKTRLWRAEKIAHRIYGAKYHEEKDESAEDDGEKVVIEGGLPDDHN